ncbi:MAG: RNA polymerase factor sigma-70 [Candidatus Aquicultor primus]|uniref:RNA polymerase sigma factor SigS n=1 Tax=Candidatus Aquicultor primus TaxID=1797195 RepID=A0A1F2UG46_9ACTN|nr:RNA polymerase sporulation sigma factor SigH [Candidatus Aquicultor sp.]OFW31999.1 MAG: RNA polymerase factor sigma-70 [Candidatus Aquicultor primus]HCG98311.1 RNA polymerase sporulation sigma factor SigH [Actinomycetota bacterium]
MQVQTESSRHHPSIFFETLSDPQLVVTAREGNDAALEHLLHKYKNFVKIKARAYFLIGADWDDLVQEGMIGLYKAIRDYRDDRQASFRAFAELCITRQIITAIKTATRQKHIPLNSYVSLNRPVYFEDESDRLLADLLCGEEITDPIDLIISGEEMQSMRSSFSKILSELEAKVLKLYIDGRSYQEIADDLDRHVKSIDNALQRIKRKIELHLRSRLAES